MLQYCEVCQSLLGKAILDLGLHPLPDDLVSFDSDVEVAQYHQRIVLCEVCLTAHQTIPVSKEKLFKTDYHYRAALTGSVISGMTDLVEQSIKSINTQDKKFTVLDIGCNDGSLLGIFKKNYLCTTIGVDPTSSIFESGDKIDFKFNEYFSRSTVDKIKSISSKIDLITFTNVFAHIENLAELINNIKLLITDKTTVIIENHYLGSILEKSQFDSFYHEHPRTYSLKSFEFISENLGLNITDIKFPSRYGGNIRVTMNSNKISQELERYKKLEHDSINAFKLLQNTFSNWKIQSKPVFESLLKHGPVYGKALPARAVMLINSLGIDDNAMPVVFEQPNSPKVGKYVPGSKIKILSDKDLLKINPKIIIVWAWHIIDEVVDNLKALNFQGEIWSPLPEFKIYPMKTKIF